jgi:hypothetical protein
MCDMSIGSTVCKPFLILIDSIVVSNHGLQLRRGPSTLECIVHSVEAIKSYMIELTTDLAWDLRDMRENRSGICCWSGSRISRWTGILGRRRDNIVVGGRCWCIMSGTKISRGISGRRKSGRREPWR